MKLLMIKEVNTLIHPMNLWILMLYVKVINLKNKKNTIQIYFNIKYIKTHVLNEGTS